MQPSHYYRPPQVGRMLGMSPKVVIGFIRAGLLPAIDVSSPDSKVPRYIIAPADLEAFLQSRRTVKPPPKTRRKARDEVKQYV